MEYVRIPETVNGKKNSFAIGIYMEINGSNLMEYVHGFIYFHSSNTNS